MAIIIQTEKELRKNLFEIFSKMNSNNKNKHSVLNLKYINNSQLFESPTPQETFQTATPADSKRTVDDLSADFFKNFLSKNEQLYSETTQDKALQTLLINLKNTLNKNSGKVAKTDDTTQQIENDKLIALVAQEHKKSSAFNWDPNASFLDPLLKKHYTQEELMGDSSGQFANESLVQGKDSFFKTQNVLDVTSILLSIIPYCSKNRAILKANPYFNIADSIISLLSLQNRWSYLTKLHKYNAGKNIEADTVNDVKGIPAKQFRTVKAGELDDAIFWERVFLCFDILGAIPLIGVFSTVILDICKNSDKLFGQMGRQFAQSPVLIRHVDSAGQVQIKTLSPWITFEELQKLENSSKKIDHDKYDTYVAKAKELGLDISGGVPSYLHPLTNIRVFNEVAGNAVTDALIIKAEAQLKMSMMLNLEIDDDLLKVLTTNTDLVEWADKIIVKIPDDISKVTDANWEELYNFTQKLINQNLLKADALKDIDNWKGFKNAYNNNDFLNSMTKLRQNAVETFEKIKPNFNLFNTQGPNPKLYGSNSAEFKFDTALFGFVKDNDTCYVQSNTVSVSSNVVFSCVVFPYFDSL